MTASMWRTLGLLGPLVAVSGMTLFAAEQKAATTAELPMGSVRHSAEVNMTSLRGIPTPDKGMIAVRGPKGGRHVGMEKPFRGKVLDDLPADAYELKTTEGSYYYANGDFYRKLLRDGRPRYVGVKPPAGLVVPKLPEKYITAVRNEQVYYWDRGVTYTVNHKDTMLSFIVCEMPERTVDFGEEGEQNPFRILKEMSQCVGGLKNLRVEVADYVNGYTEKKTRVQIRTRRVFSIRRPDGIHATAQGDEFRTETVFDGKTLAASDPGRNVYAIIDAPGTIDDVLTDVVSEYRVTLPVSQLLHSDFYSAVKPVIEKARYIGKHYVGAAMCHHLSFQTGRTDWQIWVDAGDKPFPRRLYITDYQSPDRMYLATLEEWQANPDFGKNEFALMPSADAKQVELASVNPKRKVEMVDVPYLIDTQYAKAGNP